MTGHIKWEAFKHPVGGRPMKFWGFRDELGFTFLSNDRDGWRTKRVVELLNDAEARVAAALNPHPSAPEGGKEDNGNG